MKSRKRSGDKGMTTLSGNGLVSKADERIALIGTIEELGCYIGLMKAESSCPHLCAVFERIRAALAEISRGVRAVYCREPVPKEEEITFLEHQIEHLKTAMAEAPAADAQSCSAQTEHQSISGTRSEMVSGHLVTSGKGRDSVMFALAASVTRRAERALITVDRRYGVHAESRSYLNRLSEYFDCAASYRALFPSDEQNTKRASVAEKSSERRSEAAVSSTGKSSEQRSEAAVSSTGKSSEQESEAAAFPGKGYSDKKETGGASSMALDKNKLEVQQVVRQVLNEMNGAHEITLQEAKRLIQAVEEESERRGAKSVICVCNAHGNPVAIHVMDGAFLVSFDAAQKKAYSAAAVKMPTLELAKLAVPGGTFYGVDRLDDGRITLIGGGRPLMKNGVLCGAVGVSGGTGEEDDSLAAFAVDVYMDKSES